MSDLNKDDGVKFESLSPNDQAIILIEKTKTALQMLEKHLSEVEVENVVLKDFSDFCKNYSVDIRELMYSYDD